MCVWGETCSPAVSMHLSTVSAETACTASLNLL